MTPKRWLITGGCGFIGSNLVRRLLTTGGYSIRLLDNHAVGTPEDLLKVCGIQRSNMSTHLPTQDLPWPEASKVQLFTGDIADPESCVSAAQSADIIVHLAANTGVAPSIADPKADCETNVLGTLNLLEAARKHGVRRFLFASSGAPVGDVEPPIREDVVPHPVSPYGASKLAGEAYCSAYFRTFQLSTVALRFSNVYGPGSWNKESVVAKFVKNALTGESLEIFGDGGQTRDFLYIDDLIDALLKASVSASIAGEVLQIATNQETSIAQLAHLLRVITTNQHDIGRLELKHSSPRLGDVRRNYADIDKARRLLGWHPRVKLRAGLETTLNSLADHLSRQTSKIPDKA